MLCMHFFHCIFLCGGIYAFYFSFMGFFNPFSLSFFFFFNFHYYLSLLRRAAHKKKSVDHRLVFHTVLPSLCSRFDVLSELRFLRVSFSTSDLVFWWILFAHWKDYHAVRVNLTCVSAIALLLSSVSSMRSAIAFFFCFCLGYSHFDNIFGTFHNFLIY